MSALRFNGSSVDMYSSRIPMDLLFASRVIVFLLTSVIVVTVNLLYDYISCRIVLLTMCSQSILAASRGQDAGHLGQTRTSLHPSTAFEIVYL